MDRRNLLAGLVVLALGVFGLAGSASAHGTVSGAGTEGEGSCTVKSLPSFVAQGEFESAATVGDIIEVSCDPYKYSAGAEVTLTAAQLWDRCHYITWYDANDEGYYRTGEGRSFSVHLDVDGNANVGLIAGPRCMVGESLITLDENESPYETFTTSFQVLPAVNTPAGLYITPSSQVEDAESSGVITIAQAEFSGASEQSVRIGAKQLYDRCERGHKLIIVRGNRVVVDDEGTAEGQDDGELLNAIELDNNGNGFVLLIGTDSCAEGESLIESDLESSPFTTQTGTFTVEAPRPRVIGG
jgi:hypothetical protein